MDPVKAKANYSRVCQLLINKGGIALRDILHKLLHPSTLAAELIAHKGTLKKIRKCVINDRQWDLLFPASGSPDSNDFDITLLTILLRNICALPSPRRGWDVMPPATDTSVSADIARIKNLRNEIYGHTAKTEYDDTTFENYWQDISTPLIRLGISPKDIGDLKVASLISKIEQLAKCDFTSKINNLCKKFQDGTRQWFFDQLSSWFNDEESRVMILTAGPGVGKSVLLAKICEMYKQYGQLAACHFCDFKKSDYSNPYIILESLASQMCDNVDGFREGLNKVLNRKHSRDLLSDAFRVFLEDPLNGLNKTEPMLIVIDALDESKIEAKSEFLDLIADEFEKLPEWIKILISSRPELQVRKKLEFLNPLEILPDDHHHLSDLNQYIRSSMLNVSEDDLLSLISESEGSFLYAYYLVIELKQGDQGWATNNKGYRSKGIGGFYHKQFTRLKTGLQRCKPNAWSPILKIFINVIAASKEPLLCKILFTCMGLSSEEFEVREMIVGIMSEILPIYDNSLTVYHKSLWDWLTLNGYDEHAFVADVEDGKYRLWQACENVYRDIVSLGSFSDFQISPETNYALKSGEKWLLEVGSGEDFHWLVNVRLNFLKLQSGMEELDFFSIFKFYKSKHSNCHYWGNIHMHAFFYMCSELFDLSDSDPNGNIIYSARDWPYLYLQSLANGYFDFVQKATSGKNEARNILNENNKVWVEEIGNEYISNNRIISHAIMGDIRNLYFEGYFDALAVSPDNKLIAHKDMKRIEVFNLPNLSMVLSLEIEDSQQESEFLQFSPDSLHLVWNSARSCLSLTDQMEVPLIPHGPENVDCVSFSPCGMKLVTCEENVIKLWNVKSQGLLAEIKTDFHFEYSIFSDCNSYIFAISPPQMEGTHDFPQTFNPNYVAIFNSTNLERLDNNEIICRNRCLTNKDIYQIISPPPTIDSNDAQLRYCHFHSPTGRIVLISNKYCSNPFEWKGKSCVIFLNSDLSPLVFYDFINEEVVDVFHIDCLPTQSSLRCVSKLDGSKFLVGLDENQAFVLSLEASTESCKRETRFVSASDIICYALSPDDSYIACCSEALTVINVDNGKTSQNVELKHRPEACWWSEFNLWLICNGMVVKYPYNLKVLGNEIEECSINFESVVVFMNGVLVIRPSDYTGICMLKICDKKLYPQQIPDSNFIASSATVSSDGCAVLLYRESGKDYQLWEIACEHKWELRSSGEFDEYDQVAWYCLTGTEKFQTSIWLTAMPTMSDDLFNEPLVLSSINFVTQEKTVVRELLFWQRSVHQVISINSKSFILHNDDCIHFISVASGEIITSFVVGPLLGYEFVASFFLPSRRLLLLGGKRSIKIFRVRNLEKFLPDLTED